MLRKVEKLLPKRSKLDLKTVISKVSTGDLMDMYQRFIMRLNFKIIKENEFFDHY